MDVEFHGRRELNLPQAFLLLATNDEDGGPEVPQPVLQAGVAGAILAELELLGAVELQGKNVQATGAAPESDFGHQLDAIRHKSRPHTPKRWVSIFESRAEVRRIYEGMVAQEIVEHVGEKHLGLFTAVRYPEKDHAPEAALRKRIEGALSGEAPDARIAALISLLHAAGLLRKLFPEADESLAREMAANHWPSHAVADELRMIRLAEAEAAT
ncbi:GPP34 family phosphoprotein [Pseudarthrobacter sp. NamE2]|uniref:GOLPH3/VPS74 family protein n=1 Tax=Pseudarthrobacter sp. NamE2 TaxID=2576838 RepID=UPI0010FE427A|nr:GPP34 family phosphoprotein [Pseudarthrobacter sp. NamE2]TLM82688.1 GPP34 family phosphoprotein [Pseudarthrobacter sp. NamE2]